MIRHARVLALHAFQEHLRDRSFRVTLLFSGVLIYMSLLLGMLAVDQEARALLDFGLAMIELMALALTVFSAATGFLKEMETKTIYLILTRPVPRSGYLLGRYLGLLLCAGCAILAMSAVHLSLLFLKGWAWRWDYCLAMWGIFLKISLAAALASFLALLATSALSALAMTGILWTLGHFVPELSFLARRHSNWLAAAPLRAATHLIPNLQLLNFRDRLDVPASVAAGEPLGAALVYAALYSAACLALACALLRRREF